MRVKNSPIDYRYLDDPNELIRLRLSIASKRAGNTVFDSEIVAILDELHEAGIIKDFENVKF